MKTTSFSVSCSLLLLAATSLPAQAQLLWMVGKDDDDWPLGDGGGPNTSFVQENGSNNPLPGSPVSTEVSGGADNDYYFAGDYTTAIASVIALYGDYAPVGVVAANEEAAERAFAGGDTDLRYHFNLADTLLSGDLLSVTFDALYLDDRGENTDPRYGVEVYFNGVLVQPEILIRPGQLGNAYTTPQFSLASVNAQVGLGYDNIVTLKAIRYNAEGGGDWMGIDYVQLNPPGPRIPPAVFPWAVGLNDDGWPLGDGGGPNTSFVEENGAINPLPGSPVSTEVPQGADNDYYFAGSYTTVIAGNGTYTPVGLVPVNEEAAERAFAGDDNDLRYHFNLPNTLTPNHLVSVTFDANNLDDTAADPRYGVEVYLNGVRVQTAVLIRPAQLGQTISTLSFKLGSVNAKFGSGFDNIVSLRGINHSAEGGGNWMGIDYIQLNPSTTVIPPPVLPWSVGRDDNAWPLGDGGGANASFVQENGVINPLPGSAINEEFDQDADNDYYFAGAYTTVIAGNGTYTPVGLVPVNEEAAERAFAAADNDLRYHFNLPANLTPEDLLSITFDALNLDDPSAVNTDPRYGVEVYFNGVRVQSQIVIRPAQLDVDYTTPQFTLASVNAQVGPGFDNIISLRGINYNADGGGNWMGIDYVQLNPIPRASFPWAVGRDDGSWPFGDGGGPNTSFVQENGRINPLPGSPVSTEVSGGADNDYYFAGIYTTVIDGNGAYAPVGVVLVNEEAAERAFAAEDNDLRYHFNLPNTLRPEDLLTVTFDANNLDDRAEIADPRYGIEVYFNGVRVQSQIVIRPPQVGVTYTTPQFSLASVDAKVGPGFDNIVSLRGINYDAEGGGNWMGIDYVQLNPLGFLPPVVSNGQVTLNWTGTGELEWAPTVLGPWTPIAPVPTSPYTEAIVPGENRFYRLKKP